MKRKEIFFAEFVQNVVAKGRPGTKNRSVTDTGAVAALRTNGTFFSSFSFFSWQARQAFSSCHLFFAFFCGKRKSEPQKEIRNSKKEDSIAMKRVHFQQGPVPRGATFVETRHSVDFTCLLHRWSSYRTEYCTTGTTPVRRAKRAFQQEDKVCAVRGGFWLEPRRFYFPY